ncbi:MAG: hypothetical protein HC897_08805 [Thermoanaerobaculia bacterium]|nr:hypothetical protein [Thermoanaerobaculia bacterium]
MTVVITLSLLLGSAGSVVAEVASAVFESVPVAAGSTDTVSWQLAMPPLASVPAFQVQV